MKTKYLEDYFDNQFCGGYESQADNPTYEKKAKEIIALGYKKGKVLDIGCAYGYFLRQFEMNGFTTYGIDISTHALKEAKKNCLAKLFMVDVSREKIPLDNVSIDVIVEMFLLEHLENYFHCLQETYRVLKKGGLLFIYLPTERRWFNDKTHINLFTLHSLRFILEKLRFRILKLGEEGGQWQIPLGLARLIFQGNTYFNFVPSGTGSFICCYAVK